MLDAKILKIAARGGTRKPVHFARTNYDIGGRGIKISVNGKSALLIGESCAAAGYHECDARLLHFTNG